MSSPSAKSPKSPDHKRLRNGAQGSGQAHGPEHMDISTPVENGPPTMSAAAAAAGPVDSWVQSLPGTGKDRSRTDPARRDGGRRTGVAQPLIVRSSSTKNSSISYSTNCLWSTRSPASMGWRSICLTQSKAGSPA